MMTKNDVAQATIVILNSYGVLNKSNVDDLK